MENLDMKFSVIITLYNKAPYIARTLVSVLKQRKKPHEIIIIDDVSTDNSLEVANATLAQHSELCEGVAVHLIQHSKNGGPSVARNTALRAVTGDYVFLLDADDEYHDGVFLHAERIFEAHAPSFLFLQFERDIGGRVLPAIDGLREVTQALGNNVYELPNIVAAFGHDSFGMNGSSVVCKRSALDGVFYRENLNCFEGLEYWYRVVKGLPEAQRTACLLGGIQVTIHLTENSVSRRLVDNGGEIYLPAQFSQLRGSDDIYDQKLRKRIYTIWVRNAFLKLPSWYQRTTFIWRFKRQVIDNIILNWRYGLN
jgi:glycosyltransferase involved in cell wall biosynthesis